MDAEQLVRAGVHAALLAALIDVEPAPRLAAQPSRLHESRHAGGGLEAVAVGGQHDVRHLLGDVETDLIEQGHRSHGITSSRGIFATGEKKCIPTTRWGDCAASAMLLMGIVEVLDAKTPVSGIAPSISRSTCCLTAMSSKTASITSSARPNP